MLFKLKENLDFLDFHQKSFITLTAYKVIFYVLCDNFYKSNPKCLKLFGLFEKITFKKNLYGYFLGKFRATFISTTDQVSLTWSFSIAHSAQQWLLTPHWLILKLQTIFDLRLWRKSFQDEIK